MSWWDSATSALDSGAVQSAVEVGTQAVSNDSWWSTALDWGTSAFQWMDDNPTAANVLGGVVGGAGQYLLQRDLAKREERAAERRWRREREAQMIRPGNVQGYGSHGNKFGGGLLTDGMISGYRDLSDRKGV